MVIDFIDMMNNRNQRAVENRLNDAVQADRARVQIGRISRFGLLEMSRQRLKPSLGESTQIVCPRCTGQGTIRTVESLSLSLVRIIEEEALKTATARVDIQVPIDVATYMLNEKRQAILDIEKLTGVHVLIVANPTLETPQYKVERVRKSEHDESDETASYERAERDDQYRVEVTKEKPIQPEKAAVSSISPGVRPTAKAPEPEVKPNVGLLGKIVSIFAGGDKAEKEKEEEKEPETRQRSSRSRSPRNGSNRSRGSRGRGRSSRSRGRKQDASEDSKKRATTQSSGKQASGKQAKGADNKDASRSGEQSSAQSKQGGQKSGGSSGRGRRRRSSSRSKSGDAKSNGNAVKADTSSAEKSSSGSRGGSSKGDDADKQQAQKSRAAKPQSQESQAPKPKEKQPGSDKPRAESAKPASEKKTQAKPAEKKPDSAPAKSASSGDSEKQPSSNENRPVTSAADD